MTPCLNNLERATYEDLYNSTSVNGQPVMVDIEEMDKLSKSATFVLANPSGGGLGEAFSYLAFKDDAFSQPTWDAIEKEALLPDATMVDMCKELFDAFAEGQDSAMMGRSKDKPTAPSDQAGSNFLSKVIGCLDNTAFWSDRKDVQDKIRAKLQSLNYALSTKERPATPIVGCSFPHNPSRTCKFQPIFTDNGLCYGFNGRPMSDVMRPSKHLDLFEKTYNVTKEAIQKNVGHQVQNRLVAWVDMENIRYGDVGTSEILVSINNERDFFAIKGFAGKARVGRFTTFHYTPTLHTVSENLDTLDVSSRECR